MGKNGAKRTGPEDPVPAVLRGSALATVDGDGRLKMPAAFRRWLEHHHGAHARLYLTSLSGDSMWVYPLSLWQRKERKILAAAKRTPALEEFIRRTSYYGDQADIDAQGRILAPQVLRLSARLEGEVAVLGALDHLEVWQNALFRQRLDQD